MLLIQIILNDVWMQISPISQNPLEFNKNMVNKAVRICIKCGNIAVHIQNHIISCKNCNSFFNIDEKDNVEYTLEHKIKE